MALNPNILTSVVFQDGMNELWAAFVRKGVIPEETLKVYFRRLNFCRDKDFLQAVNDILDKGEWFPTIKVFLDWLPEPEKWEPSIDDLVN